MTLLREKILPGLLFLFCICLVPLPGEARETPPALTCLNGKLQSAMVSGKNEDVYALFKAFFHEYGTVYSIQWIDEKGLNRFGYPDENSLINYDCTAPGSMRGVKMMKTLSRRREASFDTSLVEGRKGHVLMVPVQSHGRYLGMIYAICIKP